MYQSIFNRFPVIQPVSSKVRHFSTFFAHFGLHLVRLWDNRGKIVTWVEWEFNAGQTHSNIPIYLQPFTSYSEILVGNCNFFLPLVFNAPVGGVPIGIPRKSLVLRKLESWGYQTVKTIWQVESFRHNTSVWRTDRRTDRRPAYINNVRSILTHVKNPRVREIILRWNRRPFSYCIGREISEWLTCLRVYRWRQ